MSTYQIICGLAFVVFLVWQLNRAQTHAQENERRIQRLEDELANLERRLDI